MTYSHSKRTQHVPEPENWVNVVEVVASIVIFVFVCFVVAIVLGGFPQ